MCLQWTVGLWSLMSRDIRPTMAHNDLLGSPYTLPFVLCLTVATAIVVLLTRYTVSAKWQAIYAKPRFTKDIFLAPPAAAPNVRILHASDFHITSDDSEPVTEGGATFSYALLTSIMNAISKDARDCDTALFTGDITDTGSAQAWERFVDSCPPELQSKLILVPGNHDLNLQDGLLALKAEHMSSTGRRNRQTRMILAMVEIMKDRAYVFDRATDRIFPLEQYIERRWPKFTSAHVNAAPPPSWASEQGYALAGSISNGCSGWPQAKR